jgi:hypothetical protein
LCVVKIYIYKIINAARERKHKVDGQLGPQMNGKTMECSQQQCSIIQIILSEVFMRPPSSRTPRFIVYFDNQPPAIESTVIFGNYSNSGH